MDGLIITGLAGLAGKFVHDIGGPLAKELGEMLRDELRPYRAVQQKRLLEKTAKMLQDAEIQANPVPPKLLIEIFDAAGLEDDESLHTMWATLLANAANTPESIIPACVDILKQLSRNDVFFLEELIGAFLEKDKRSKTYPNYPAYADTLARGLLGLERYMISVFGTALERNNVPKEDKNAFALCKDNLLRLRMIQEELDIGQDTERLGGKIHVATHYRITELGGSFMEACQPPKKKPEPV